MAATWTTWKSLLAKGGPARALPPAHGAAVFGKVGVFDAVNVIGIGTVVTVASAILL